jgi:hypothetical protein
MTLRSQRDDVRVLSKTPRKSLKSCFPDAGAVLSGALREPGDRAAFLSQWRRHVIPEACRTRFLQISLTAS